MAAQAATARTAALPGEKGRAHPGGRLGEASDFKDILKGRVVVVGVGNRLRGDDAAGPLLARRLARRCAVACVDAGSALENHLGAIIRRRPDTVLLVDAVHLGRSPGQWEFLDPGRIEEQGLSTHDLSLRLCLEYLGWNIDGAVFLLGLQPRSVRFGGGLSGPVRRSLRVLEQRIAEAIAGETADVRARNPKRME